MSEQTDAWHHASDDAASIPAAERLARTLDHYFTAEERALFTCDDIAFLLTLDDDVTAPSSPEYTLQVVEHYRERLYAKLARVSSKRVER